MCWEIVWWFRMSKEKISNFKKYIKWGQHRPPCGAAPPSWRDFNFFNLAILFKVYMYISHIWKNWTLKAKAWTLKASHRQDCTASTRVPLTTNRGRTIYPFNRLILYSCSRKNSSQNLYGQKNVASPLYSKNLDYKNYIRLPKNLTDSSNPTISLR